MLKWVTSVIKVISLYSFSCLLVADGQQFMQLKFKCMSFKYNRTNSCDIPMAVMFRISDNGLKKIGY